VKLQNDESLSNFAFKFHLRRYSLVITNPDMLHASIVPQHRAWTRVLRGQGLTLVHFVAQLEPCLTQKTPYTL
jgi:hypothetical protein